MVKTFLLAEGLRGFWKMLAITMAVVVMTMSRGEAARPCRTFCGNVTVDYPFGVEEGCGHPEYRDLLFCINNVMMMSLASGSYQVLNIDYGFHLLNVFDPKMSTCHSMHGNSEGFVVEQTRSRYLQPTVDNAFLLLGCSKTSPLFEGFPDRHLPCQNVSGMGCDAFYECPAWAGLGQQSKRRKPPPCCAIPYTAIGPLNLTELHCYSYSSAYASAPLHNQKPADWSYGVQLSFQMPSDSDFCRRCKASTGVCGYAVDAPNANDQICLCDGWNSTSTCDAGNVSSGQVSPIYRTTLFASVFAGIMLVFSGI
uniref:Wall-associated receptor kinase galacturonan-binding domain-containing protein n=1 Tax=Araucaria cunninghamii TaxID=56994 RepID=A0A0D6R9S0_ARACU